MGDDISGRPLLRDAVAAYHSLDAHEASSPFGVLASLQLLESSSGGGGSSADAADAADADIRAQLLEATSGAGGGGSSASLLQRARGYTRGGSGRARARSLVNALRGQRTGRRAATSSSRERPLAKRPSAQRGRPSGTCGMRLRCSCWGVPIRLAVGRDDEDATDDEEDEV